MEEPWNPDLLLVCPYDETHRIAASRFQGHIIKCRKNHPDKDTVACPFNATHILLRPSLRAHLGKCPDRVAIDADVIQAQSDETGEVERLMGRTALPERNWESPEDSEDWDQEAEQHEHEKCARNVDENGSTEHEMAFQRPTIYPYAQMNGSGFQHLHSKNSSNQSNTYSCKQYSITNDANVPLTSHALADSSSYVRMAGRGFKPAVASRANRVNETHPPGRSNAPENQPGGGQGRGTKLFRV